MKRKQLQEARVKEVKELVSSLIKKQREVGNTILELRAGKVKNVHTVRALRREIAQLHTLIKEKAI